MRTRPPKLTDPAEVERICRAYLDDCAVDRERQTVILKSGAHATYGEWPSTEGLALALGISYGTLMRYISQAPDNGGEGDYRGRESVPPSNSPSEILSSIQDTDSTALITGDRGDTRDDLDTQDEYEHAQREIRETLARVRVEIIRTITQATDNGLIDSKIAQLRLARLGVAVKAEGDTGRKLELVGYTADEISDLFK